MKKITETEFWDACEMGDLEVIKQFIDQGGDVKSEDNYSFYLTCRFNKQEALEMLLKAVNFDSEVIDYCIYEAEKYSKTKIVKFLKLSLDN